MQKLLIMLKYLLGYIMVFPKGENGMIIKYRNPPHGIARRDAIKDYRPEIPFSPIKQPVKPLYANSTANTIS